MTKLARTWARFLCMAGHHDWTLYVGPLQTRMVPPALTGGRLGVFALSQYQVVKCARCQIEMPGSAVRLQAEFDRQVKRAAAVALKAAADLDHLVLTRRASRN